MKKVLLWLLRQLKRLVIFRDERNISFAFVGFLICAAVQGYAIVKLSLWAHPLNDVPWYTYVGWFVGARFVISGFEWFYHRYVLHMVVIFWKVLISQTRTHGIHHGLTNVTTRMCEFPIEHSGQIESSTFPFYAPSAFSAFFALSIVPLQMVFPGSPVAVSCFAAVTFSLILYETYHAAMHLEYERWWSKGVERYPFVYKVYCFHFVHHYRPGCNLAIGGFSFVIWLWDWLMGTLWTPLSLDFTQPFNGPGKAPKPRWLTRVLDNAAVAIQKRSKRAAASP